MPAGTGIARGAAGSAIGPVERRLLRQPAVWRSVALSVAIGLVSAASVVVQAVALATPILLTAMVVGLAISLFQSVTSIQEQTLTFVPKALAIVGLLIVMMPWMLRTMIEFTTAMIEKMPQMVR